MSRRAAVEAAVIVLTLTAFLTGLVTVRGGDWTIGTNTHYCGVWWPRWDFYCETTR